MADNNVTLRKRQQIENAGRTMFMWVAIASVVVGVAGVLSASLYERLAFNNKIIGKMNETANTLKANNETADTLKENVRVLNTDEDLLNTPRLESSEPVSVVLDALPSQPNSSALGASLQQKLLSLEGVTIESLIVEPISGVEDDSENSTTSEASNNKIAFSFTITTGASGGADRFRQVLRNLEKSIRVVDLQTTRLEQRNDKLTLNATGTAFYQLEKKVELKDEAVKP